MRYIKYHRLFVVIVCFVPSLAYGLVLPDVDINLDLYRSEYRSIIAPDQYAEEVIKLGQYLESSVKSINVTYRLKIMMEELKKAVPDLAKIEEAKVALRTELAGAIADDKVGKLIGYMEGKNPTIFQKIDWTLWRDAYDITQEIPQGDVFLLIKDLNIGYEKLYNRYFSNHQGKTMVVFSWDVARENYIRQVMYDFIERYENKIYAVIPNYGIFNNIDYKLVDYSEWHEIIGSIINWVKSNTNLPCGLTICKTTDDSDDRFALAMQDLKYDFAYLWGLHDFTYEFGIEFGIANNWVKGRPVIIGGYWGDRNNPIGILPDAILDDISYKFPSFIAMRKNEGWQGIHIIGDRWEIILNKCKDRGIILQ